jgi:hypothetical protein
MPHLPDQIAVVVIERHRVVPKVEFGVGDIVFVVKYASPVAVHNHVGKEKELAGFRTGPSAQCTSLIAG